MEKHSLKEAVWFLRPALMLAALLASAHVAFADDQVALVQEALKLQHFYYGDVDGTFDGPTQSALRRYQFRNGIPGTAEMDAVTLQALIGKAPASNATGATMFARAVSDRDLGLENQKEENAAEVKPVARADETRGQATASDGMRTPRGSARGGYTEQFPSWAAEHRQFMEDGVEVRRAIPVLPKSGNEEQVIPRAIPVSPVSSMRETSAHEVVISELGHFSGQDGHVYTYTRKVRMMVPDTSSSPFPGSGETESSTAQGYGATAVSNVAVSTWPPVLIWTQTR